MSKMSETNNDDDASNKDEVVETKAEKKTKHRNKLAAMFENAPLMGMKAPTVGFIKKKREEAEPKNDEEEATMSKESLVVSENAAVTKNLEEEDIAGISMLYKEGERGRSKSRAHLESLNVLPPNSSTVAPALSGVQMELDRKMKKDRLEALYSDRPEKDEVEPQVFVTSKAPPPLPAGRVSVVDKKKPPPIPVGRVSVVDKKKPPPIPVGRVSVVDKTKPPPIPSGAVAKIRASVTSKEEEKVTKLTKKKAAKVVINEPKKSKPRASIEQKPVRKKSEPGVNLSSLDFPELSRHRVASMQMTQAGMPGLLELVRMLQVRLTTLQHEQSQLVSVNSQLRQEINTLRGYTTRFSMQDLEALLGTSTKKTSTQKSAQKSQKKQSVIVAPANTFLQTGGDKSIKTVFFQGWLMKEGSWGSWKRRYFCIYEDRVEYYASPNDTLKPSESLHFGKLLCAITPMKKRKGVKKECMELAYDDGRKQKCWRFYVAGDIDHKIANQWLQQFRNRIEHMEYLRTCLLNHQIPDVRLLKFFNSQLGSSATPLLVRDKPLSFYTVRAISNVLGDPDFPCRPIAELDVANAGMCPEEVVLLGSSYAECLKQNRKNFPAASLRKLDMSGNEVGSGEGIKELASALRLGHSLRYLTLHKCQLGDGGAIILAKVLPHTQLVRLGLSRNHIGDKGAKALANAIRSGTNNSKKHKSISIQDRMLLKNETSVKKNENERRSISEQRPPTMEDIERETKHSLTYLDLSYNDIGEDGGVIIGEMLEAITRLENIYLQNNKLNDIAAKSIASGIKKNTFIRVVDLSMNVFHHDGGVALTNMIQINRSLDEAHFMGHHLHQNALTALRMVYQSSEN